MSVYTELPKCFEEKGIDDAKSLAVVLQRIPDSDIVGHKYWEKAPEAHELGEKICGKLVKVAEKLDSLYQGFGIQQFSLSVRPRVAEEDIKKALFLSRMATVFTSHEFKYSSINYMTMYGDEAFTNEWRISGDFIRDLFFYRKAIKRGELIILPRSVTYVGGWHGQQKTRVDFSLLEELERTRVIGLYAKSELVDAIVARYKRDRQLIVLPDISMPWITEIGLNDILKVRDDHGDLLDGFQRAYHRAILAYIENHKSLDFERISGQINEDLILPKIAEMERKYKRIASLHRNLASAGALVSLLPIGGVIIGGTLFRSILSGDIGTMIPATIAGVVSALSINRIHQHYVSRELEDEDFYIIWQLSKEKRKLSL